jgi:site-specific DNA-methyltransferase (adenine-specific)
MTASRITLLPPRDALETLARQRSPVALTMLDPWYNKGVGGARDDYFEFIHALLSEAARFSDHVMLWGFPEIIWRALARVPEPLSLVAWLTWTFRNCPSVIRGWRSAQMTCLHLARPGATLHPEHFLNEAQQDRQRRGKLRYMPGPPSVIEVPLNIGFVGRAEQTGHPAQKPVAVYRPLIEMTTLPGETVLDPMCGSGTTGAACRALGRHAILCDGSAEYTAIVERRLGIRRSAAGRGRTSSPRPARSPPSRSRRSA